MTFKPRTRTRARRLGGLLAGTLALGLVPLASPASAGHPPARDIGVNACPVFEGTGDDPDTTQVPEDGFTDVPSTNSHEFAIDCVAWYQITSGKTATTYAPAANIRRDQMATFIAQTIDYVAGRTANDTDGLPAVPSGNRFSCDVNTNNVHFSNIQRLAAAGVVRGTSTNSAGDACFDPDGAVTRGQMATFLREAQAEIFGGEVPDAATDHFVDDNTSTHEDNINAIAEEGLAEGASRNTNNEDIYNPDADVRRDQMGSFIARTLDRLIDVTDAVPPPVAAVSVSDTSPQRGVAFNVIINADRGTVDSATIDGCGIDANSNPDPDVDTATIPVTIPATQATGNCTITVVSTFSPVSGNVYEQTNEIEVTVTSAP